MKSTETISRILFWSALITSWVVFSVFPFFWFIPFAFWVISLASLWIHKSRLKWWLIGLSAWTVLPFLSFCFGVNDYTHGKAFLRTVGLPAFGFENLNKEYRVHTSSSGCLVTGIEPFINYPNNVAVKVCTKLFGYQKGVYGGFYPSFEESNDLINKHGREFPFVVKNDTLEVTHENSEYKLWVFTFNRNHKLNRFNTKAKIVSRKNELIIVSTASDSLKIVYLIDSKTGKNFAKYAVDVEEISVY
ncbi:hypothetical protein SAMN04489761_0077 [Tenacibaculum sp. MAR_2009_124]|uniref:hypothetical protein n=1 Tax=Tenacibaculum sp. MAR_2009_124 TaxID=1250059 RepID=UPI00089BDE71|nr:hypothetical protein [Tenacibaculum sp. MAR_2009_124]SEB35629.1 hypothetical protein SAMN04489761_0077 [Tenacibaculum sp. MAR_2009_124]